MNLLVIFILVTCISNPDAGWSKISAASSNTCSIQFGKINILTPFFWLNLKLRSKSYALQNVPRHYRVLPVGCRLPLLPVIQSPLYGRCLWRSIWDKRNTGSSFLLGTVLGLGKFKSGRKLFFYRQEKSQFHKRKLHTSPQTWDSCSRFAVQPECTKRALSLMMKFKDMALIGPFENAEELSKTDEPTMTMETSHYSHSPTNKQSNELAKTLNQKAAEPSCTRNALLC